MKKNNHKTKYEKKPIKRRKENLKKSTEAKKIN